MRFKKLGLVEYQPVFDAMKTCTAKRTSATEDEVWLLEHHPVYTQGLLGKQEHLINPGKIPVVQADRGGQVTYHGPGQWVAYVLYDLRRADMNFRQLIFNLELAVINLLSEFDISAQARSNARGVYVGHRKIASVGLKVSRGSSYHGLSLNSHLDLTPFAGINPCGYPNLEVTSILKILGDQCPPMEDIGGHLLDQLQKGLTGPF